MDAKVLDIALSHSDNAILLTVTFCYQPMVDAAAAAVATVPSGEAPPPPTTEAPPPPRASNDDDDDSNDDNGGFLNVLQYRLFHAPMEKLKDKKKLTSNGRDAHEYKHAFRAVRRAEVGGVLLADFNSPRPCVYCRRRKACLTCAPRPTPSSQRYRQRDTLSRSHNSSLTRVCSCLHRLQNIQDMSRLFCVNTCQSDVSHHVIVWYYR